MKNFFAALLSFFFIINLAAQDVRLNDSVIFINNNPIALYSKGLSNSPQRYNMEVYSFTDYVLIKAEVIKFNAPVAELRPFYYYELTFPPIADTFAIYIEEEAFPLVLGKIIRDYNLISNDQLNKKAVAYFKSSYYGGPALLAKIKSFEDYLNETRYFNEQALRDRTKPVIIINDKVIMQDGVKIGLITEVQNYNVTNRPVSVYTDKSNYGIPFKVVPDQVITSSKERQILLPNERKIDKYGITSQWMPLQQKNKTEKNLYKISVPANGKISSYTDDLLKWVCFLIENYSL